ncbi:MAG: SPASM domain-containing protein, partial [Desulfovibrio sp.]|nr:SPASM domain-containing protein [Desulfovibrio sp.]
VFGDVRAEASWDIWNKPEFAAFREAVGRNAPDAACLVCPKRFER